MKWVEGEVKGRRGPLHAFYADRSKALGEEKREVGLHALCS